MNCSDTIPSSVSQTQSDFSAAIEQSSFHLLSLGWAADGESGIGILALSEKAITKELLERYRDEQSWLPAKLEHVMDEAATVALLAQGDPEAAKADARRKVLARGIGVSFWLLDAATFEQWRSLWNGGRELLERCPESWEVFEKPPICEIALNVEFFDLVAAGNTSKEVWKAIVKTLDAG